jgi:hypothetical protein
MAPADVNDTERAEEALKGIASPIGGLLRSRPNYF